MNSWKVARLKSDAQKDFLTGMRQPVQKEAEGAQWGLCSGEVPRGSPHFEISLGRIFQYLKMTLFLIPKVMEMLQDLSHTLQRTMVRKITFFYSHPTCQALLFCDLVTVANMF